MLLLCDQVCGFCTELKMAAICHLSIMTLVTYVAGPVKSTVDYIMVWQVDKAKVLNVKVISSEECVPKHKLLVMDMWFKATKTQHRKFEPRVRVWKLKEEKTCEEYRSMVRDKVEEAKWKGLGVNLDQSFNLAKTL